MYRSRGGNNRLMRFTKDGKFIKQWGGGVGSEGYLPLQFNDPHDLAIDSDGRLYVADRGNQRIQVLDKDGNFITRWTQFGKPSAIAIDTKGNIYVADGMSDESWNPGWERGIRIGDLKSGWLKAFIPDEEATRGAGTEFLGVDARGPDLLGCQRPPRAGRARAVAAVVLRKSTLVKSSHESTKNTKSSGDPNGRVFARRTAVETLSMSFW